jgi:hypothetical protein
LLFSPVPNNRNSFRALFAVTLAEIAEVRNKKRRGRRNVRGRKQAGFRYKTLKTDDERQLADFVHIEVLK